MREWFYVNEGGKVVGPIRDVDMPRLISSGTLKSNTSVWTAEFGTEWHPLYATELQRSVLPPPPPQQPTYPTHDSLARRAVSEPIPVTVPAVSRFFRIVLVIIGIPIGLLALWMISEAVSDTQYYATSIGLSVSECRSTMIRFGIRYAEADAKCSARIPKPGRAALTTR